MRKTICLVLVLSVIGGIALINSGCGGGGGGIAGALFGVLVIAAIASSGGAGAAAFAASVRESGRPAIYPEYPYHEISGGSQCQRSRCSREFLPYLVR